MTFSLTLNEFENVETPTTVPVTPPKINLNQDIFTLRMIEDPCSKSEMIQERDPIIINVKDVVEDTIYNLRTFNDTQGEIYGDLAGVGVTAQNFCRDRKYEILGTD